MDDSDTPPIPPTGLPPHEDGATHGLGASLLPPADVLPSAGVVSPPPAVGGVVLARVGSVPVGLGLLGCAVVLVVVGLLGVSGSGFVSALLVALGLGSAYRGARSVGRALRGPRFNLATWCAGLWLVVLVAAAALAPVLPIGEYKDTTKTLNARGMAVPRLFSAHPLGTNNFGLDELARALYGARASLTVAVLAVVLGIVIGGTIGLVSGYLQGGTDWSIGVLTTTVLAFPPLILLIALSTLLRPSIRNIAIALAVLAIPTVVRLSRANTMAYAERDFVTAARSLGATRRTVIFRELMPNVLLPVASYGLVLVAVLIVAEAALSFLGLGIQPPDPSWGNMIAEGQNGVMERSPHIVLVPAMFLFLTVLSLNLVGEVLRRRYSRSESKL